MKPILRFKESVHHMGEGHLMALGAEMKPEPEAMGRVAQRMGISAAALASAQTLAMQAASATATVASAAGTTALEKGAGSFLAASAIKGAAIGLCLSGLTYVGIQLSSPSAVTVRSSSPAPSLVPRVHSEHTDPMGTAAAVKTVPVAVANGLVASPSRSDPSTKQPSSSHLASSAAGLEPKNVESTGEAAQPETPATIELPPAISSSTTGPSVAGAPAFGGLAAPASHSAGAADPRVMREVHNLDRVRTLARQGKATLALRELDDFAKLFGYRVLLTESMLVRIDVLLSLGQREAAAAVARQLLSAGAPATQRQRLMVLANASSTNLSADAAR
jgi:hypothetical protein